MYTHNNNNKPVNKHNRAQYIQYNQNILHFVALIAVCVFVWKSFILVSISVESDPFCMTPPPSPSFCIYFFPFPCLLSFFCVWIKRDYSWFECEMLKQTHIHVYSRYITSTKHFSKLYSFILDFIRKMCSSYHHYIIRTFHCTAFLQSNKYMFECCIWLFVRALILWPQILYQKREEEKISEWFMWVFDRHCFQF